MSNNNLPEIKKESIFTKIKKWFKTKLGIGKNEEETIVEITHKEETNQNNDNMVRENNFETEIDIEKTKLINEWKKQEEQEKTKWINEWMKLDDYRIIKQLTYMVGIPFSKDPKEYSLEEVDNAKRELLVIVPLLEKEKPEILIESFRRRALVGYYISNEFVTTHPEAKEAMVSEVREYSRALRGINPDIQKHHPEIVLEAVKSHPEAIYYTYTDVIDICPEIAMEAVIRDISIAENLPEKYNNPTFLLKVENEKKLREQKKNEKEEQISENINNTTEANKFKESLVVEINTDNNVPKTLKSDSITTSKDSIEFSDEEK